METEAQGIEDLKAKIPLGGAWKILAFIFPVIFRLLLYRYFRNRGYERKAWDLLRWNMYGAGFYIILSVIVELLLLLN